MYGRVVAIFLPFAVLWLSLDWHARLPLRCPFTGRTTGCLSLLKRKRKNRRVECDLLRFCVEEF